MAGNSGLIAALHERLGDRIGYSMTVGMAHHDAPPAEVTTGPTPTLFFAPTEVERRIEQWGSDAYRQRTTDALFSFVEGSQNWLSVDHRTGTEGAEQCWADAYNGAIAPSQGAIVSLA